MTDKDYQDAIWIKQNLNSENAVKSAVRLLEIIDAYATRELGHTGQIAYLEQTLDDTYSTIDATLENTRLYLKNRHIAVSSPHGSAETKNRGQNPPKTRKAGQSVTSTTAATSRGFSTTTTNPGNVPPLTTG